MEAAFWHERWQRGEIGFHEAQPNALLTAFFERLTLPADSRVFVPLCGKTRDIPWLLSQGLRVAGAEFRFGEVWAGRSDCDHVIDCRGLGARDELGQGLWRSRSRIGDS